MGQITISTGKEKNTSGNVVSSASSPSLQSSGGGSSTVGSTVLLIPSKVSITKAAQPKTNVVTEAPRKRRAFTSGTRIRRLRQRSKSFLQIGCCILLFLTVFVFIICVLGLLQSSQIIGGKNWTSAKNKGKQDVSISSVLKLRKPHLHHQSTLPTINSKTSCCAWKRYDKFRSREIIHDFRSRWSAVVEREAKRCFIFGPMSDSEPSCPTTWPRALDRKLGIQYPCLSAQALNFYGTRMIKTTAWLVIVAPMDNVTAQGSAISEACTEFKSRLVIGVLTQYSSSHRLVRSVRPGTSRVDNNADVHDTHEEMIKTKTVKTFEDAVLGPDTVHGLVDVSLLGNETHDNIQFMPFPGPNYQLLIEHYDNLGALKQSESQVDGQAFYPTTTGVKRE